MGHLLWLRVAPLVRHYGLAGVFGALLLENAGLPLPGELALLFGGTQTASWQPFGLAKLLAVAFAACVLGECVGYALGRGAGPWVRRALQLTPQRESWLSGFIARYGAVAIIGARFVTGLRSLAGVAAGLYDMAWPEFLAANLAGAALWVLALGGVAALLGREWRRWLPWLRRFDLLLLFAALALLALAWRRYQRTAAPKAL